jgi:zinc/manganese transport system substrate-binding protein
MKRIFYVLVLLSILMPGLYAKVKIVTSTSDLADLAKQIGGDRIQVDFIVKGTQNPHYIEIKPSYMLKLKSASLFIMIGMQLENWAQQIIDGSRNTNLVILDCSKNINKLEIPTYKVDASYGDVHPFGNPHYWLDPENAKIILQEILESLTQIDPSNYSYYKNNLDNYIDKLNSKISEWQNIMKPLSGKRIITYHSSFSYLLNRFGLQSAGYIEPKPGISPSPSHTAEIIKIIRDGNIKLIGVEQFYEQNTANKLASATGAKVVELCTSVGGMAGIDDYLSLIDYNVKALNMELK